MQDGHHQQYDKAASRRPESGNVVTRHDSLPLDAWTVLLAHASGSFPRLRRTSLMPPEQTQTNEPGSKLP